MKFWHLCLILLGGPQLIIFIVAVTRARLLRRRYRLALRRAYPQLIVIQGGKKRRRVG